MLLKDFDYNLPEDLIAQYPASQRENSRLLVLGRELNTLSDSHFPDIVGYLQEGDVLVVNNTRVMPARLQGKKKSGGRVEILLVRQDQRDPAIWQVMSRSSKPLRVGTCIDFDGIMQAEILETGDGYLKNARLSWQGDLEEVLGRIGTIPLPPYIDRETVAADLERYQTVFAHQAGSVAAPTAGLHFTDLIFEQLRHKGVSIVELTLHVGPGTFLPVRTEDLKQHRMHSEAYTITQEIAEAVNLARQQRRRIVAVGTTSTRALESATTAEGITVAGTAETELFVTPGYRFRAVDALVTNFHLPCSTLLMLVSAFAGRDKVMAAYRHAIAKKYRFFSYGDCMLIV